MRPLSIGVCGGTGSGKTTVTRALVSAVGAENVAFLPEDAYYKEFGHLSVGERAKINWDHPDSIESELLIEHIACLLAGGAVERPEYDFRTYTRLDKAQHVEVRPVIIVEGILILAERGLRDLLDIKVFVDTDADIRFIRRLQRDVTERDRSVPSIIEQYLATVRPMHLEFVEPSKRYADLIIPQGGYNKVAVEMLVARVRAALQSA
jgi:uridine kinase